VTIGLMHKLRERGDLSHRSSTDACSNASTPMSARSSFKSPSCEPCASERFTVATPTSPPPEPTKPATKPAVRHRAIADYTPPNGDGLGFAIGDVLLLDLHSGDHDKPFLRATQLPRPGTDPTAVRSGLVPALSQNLFATEGERASVVAAFTAEGAGELSVAVGDALTVLACPAPGYVPDGWTLCALDQPEYKFNAAGLIGFAANRSEAAQPNAVHNARALVGFVPDTYLFRHPPIHHETASHFDAIPEADQSGRASDGDANGTSGLLAPPPVQVPETPQPRDDMCDSPSFGMRGSRAPICPLGASASSSASASEWQLGPRTPRGRAQCAELKSPFASRNAAAVTQAMAVGCTASTHNTSALARARAAKGHTALKRTSSSLRQRDVQAAARYCAEQTGKGGRRGDMAQTDPDMLSSQEEDILLAAAATTPKLSAVPRGMFRGKWRARGTKPIAENVQYAKQLW
jgi:hypothetical protein